MKYILTVLTNDMKLKKQCKEVIMDVRMQSIRNSNMTYEFFPLSVKKAAPCENL